MVSGEKEEDLQPSQMGESVEGRDMARVGLQLGEGERGSAVLTSIVAFPLFWALETSLVGWVAGLRWALAFFLSLPLGGLIAYRYLVGSARPTQRRYAVNLLDMSDPPRFRDEAVVMLHELLNLGVRGHFMPSTIVPSCLRGPMMLA